ncbi:hypothetical protein FXO37_18346 [Capsicum annuum]|nr:hypothetical protein FXO37_18346 [Capsicum annuum]
MIEGFELNDDESGFSLETVAGRSGKRPVVDIQSQSDHDIQGFEDFSTLPPTKIIKKAGFLSDASASQHTKRRRTVHFDSATVEEQVYQKTPSSISTRTVSTQKIPSSGSERVHPKKATPSSSSNFRMTPSQFRTQQVVSEPMVQRSDGSIEDSLRCKLQQI